MVCYTDLLIGYTSCLFFLLFLILMIMSCHKYRIKKYPCANSLVKIFQVIWSRSLGTADV